MLMLLSVLTQTYPLSRKRSEVHCVFSPFRTQQKDVVNLKLESNLKVAFFFKPNLLIR